MRQTFEFLEGMFVKASVQLDEALVVYYSSKYFVLPISPHAYLPKPQIGMSPKEGKGRSGS